MPKNNKAPILATVPSTSSPPPPPPPPWTELPVDVTANILHRLGAVEILQNARRVCTTWRKVCKDPAMWRVIDMNDSEGLDEVAYDLKIMCRHAVDLSQGQLVDFEAEYVCTDHLLLYIAQRSCQLKRLKLTFCDDVSGRGLSQAVRKFPQLEELHLFFMLSTVGGDIEAIGRSCPMLKSFVFNQPHEICVEEGNDEYAMAIAKTMPGLRHLQLFENTMTSDGLRAILDGCPHLESLDIRQCSNVVLEGDLARKCSKQIKNLRRPSDPTDDYRWAPTRAKNNDCESFDNHQSPSQYSDIYVDDEYEFYEDYTNPFGGEYFSDQDAMFFEALAISEVFDSSYI